MMAELSPLGLHLLGYCDNCHVRCITGMTFVTVCVSDWHLIFKEHTR
jgi:hypothetical protein